MTEVSKLLCIAELVILMAVIVFLVMKRKR